ncbi:hypothetical protein ACIP4X_17635 [Streptomyces sp. NPDC088817]|uniref:hypothetical protein n=1 Tax=Streptomyces sp. NPDC088817 TaxID=3365907 RepID=UPI0037FD0DC5
MGTSIPDPLAPDPMAAIDAMELTAFRVAQTARQLRRDHPDLGVYEMLPSSISIGRAELDIHASDVDAALAWATALGGKAKHELGDYAPETVFERVTATVDVSGVKVVVYAQRILTAAEVAHFRAQQAGQDQAVRHAA